MGDELYTTTMVPTCNPLPRTITIFTLTPSFPPCFCSQARFGGILSEAIRDTHTQLTATKARLEAVSLDGASKDVIDGVTFIQVGPSEQLETSNSQIIFKHSNHTFIQVGRQSGGEEREKRIA